MSPKKKRIRGLGNKGGVDKSGNNSESLKNSVSVNLVRIEDDSELLSWIGNNLKTDGYFKTPVKQTDNTKMHTRTTSDRPVRNTEKRKITKSVAVKHTSSKQPLTNSRAKQNQDRNNKNLLHKKTLGAKANDRPTKTAPVVKIELNEISNDTKSVVKKTLSQVKRPGDSTESERKDELNVKKFKYASDDDQMLIDEQSSLDIKPSDDCFITEVTSFSSDMNDSCNTSDQLEEPKNGKSHYKSASLMDSIASGSLATLRSTVTKSNGLRNSVGNITSTCFVNKMCNKDLLAEKNTLTDVSISVEESINLISQLTGCNIHPSKVKVLPLSDTNIQEKSKFHLSDVISKSDNDIKCEPLPDSNGVNEHNDVCTVGVGSSSDSSSVNRDVIKVEHGTVRTVYDLMSEISVILPSWNLHILPDTNTFCISQVTRNKLGIPYLSKSIELDDQFKGKVYIYQQHCKKFDGIYDSEDTVAELIRDVDNFIIANGRDGASSCWMSVLKSEGDAFLISPTRIVYKPIV